MKKTSLFSKMLLGTAVFTMAFAMQSCKDENKAEDPKEVAEDENEAKFDDANEDMEKDSDYLVAAAEVDMKEIELGKLAQQKSTNKDIQALGKMMVDQHMKASADTKALAGKKNVTLPSSLTEKGKEAYEDLNGKTGHDFDKAYADMMVDGHEKTIEKMEKASEKAEDADIRMWAANMLPVLRTHLEHAKMTKEKVDAVK
jgi:putative membrane protein